MPKGTPHRVLNIMLLLVVIVFSCQKSDKKMDKKSDNRPQFLEILSWEHAEGIDPKLPLDAMRGFAVEMNKYNTLHRKDFANNKGQWFSVNYWKDETSKNVINKEAKNWDSNKAFFPAISPGSFALADYEFDYDQAEDQLSKEKALVLEVVQMKKSPSASDEDLANLLHQLTAKLNKYGDLTDRVIAKSKRGDWLLLNYWKTNSGKNKINAEAANWEENKAFGQLVDLSSLKLTSYFLRTQEPNPEEVIEIAVRSVKDGLKSEFEANREEFITVWMDNEGATVDRELQSIFSLPETANEKFIGMTSWANQEAFQKAGENPKVQTVAPNFMATFDMIAFVTARPIEGDFNLAALVQNEGEILELAIRKIKDASQKEEFHKRRKAYVEQLNKVEGVLASYELEVVMSPSGENLTIGMTEYANQEAIDLAGQTVNKGPEAAAFLEVMEVLSFNYLKTLDQ